MKVKRIFDEDKFKPIEITFTIESEDEFRVLKRLFQTNKTVPNAIFYDCLHTVPPSKASDDWNLLAQLMQQLYYGIKE